MGFFDFMQEAIAIDLGTANTLIIHNDKVVVKRSTIKLKPIISIPYHLSNILELIKKVRVVYLFTLLSASS